jgi:hypothetical protein
LVKWVTSMPASARSWIDLAGEVRLVLIAEISRGQVGHIHCGDDGYVQRFQAQGCQAG